MKIIKYDVSSIITTVPFCAGGIIQTTDRRQRVFIGVQYKSILDENGNIIKSYCYNYAGQPEDCPPLVEVPNLPTTGSVELYNNNPGLTGTTTVQLKQGSTVVKTMTFPTGPGASSVFPDVPAGTYTVSIVITGTSTPRRFTVYRYSGDDSGESKSGTSVSFTDVNIGGGFKLLIVATNL